MKVSGFLKEIAIVVIGVLIAVWINNFKERLANENYIQKTLAAIESEIDQSSSDVDTVLAKHQAIIDYLEEHYDNEEESIREVISKLGGIQVPTIKNIGLRFFIANKAELVSYEVIAHLAEIETHTEALNRKMEDLIDYGYDHFEATDPEAKIKFAYLLANVMDSEEALLNLYADFRRVQAE